MLREENVHISLPTSSELETFLLPGKSPYLISFHWPFSAIHCWTQAFLISLHLHRLFASLSHIRAADFFRSTDHLVSGLLLCLFPAYGLSFWIVFDNRSYVYLATWPGFNSAIYFPTSFTFGATLIQHFFYALEVFLRSSNAAQLFILF